jgi:hypothetical protein
MKFPCCLLVATLVAAGPLHLRAQQHTAGAAQIRTSARGTGRIVARTRLDLFGTIQGNALTSTNGPLANAMVRLRDARFGRIVAVQPTDSTGLFTFKGLDPGSYIVEIVGDDASVLAASQVININAGEAASAIVKLPFRLPPFAGILGHSAASAAVVTTEAAALSVLAIKTAGEEKCRKPKG